MLYLQDSLSVLFFCRRLCLTIRGSVGRLFFLVYTHMLLNYLAWMNCRSSPAVLIVPPAALPPFLAACCDDIYHVRSRVLQQGRVDSPGVRGGGPRRLLADLLAGVGCVAQHGDGPARGAAGVGL